jgi:hypothetical protein
LSDFEYSRNTVPKFDRSVAAKSVDLANKAWDQIDKHLRMPMKRQGLVSMYNGLDIQQSCWFVNVKVSIQTWLAIMMEPYFQDWLNIPTTPMPTPLGPNEVFIKRLYSTDRVIPVLPSKLSWKNRRGSSTGRLWAN